jgi:hypothetical protein
MESKITAYGQHYSNLCASKQSAIAQFQSPIFEFKTSTSEVSYFKPQGGAKTKPITENMSTTSISIKVPVRQDTKLDVHSRSPSLTNIFGSYIDYLVYLLSLIQNRIQMALHQCMSKTKLATQEPRHRAATRPRPKL